MKKKGAIELSMTTIIVIVLGVTLLSLGLMWLRSTFGGVMDLSDLSLKTAQGEIDKVTHEGELTLTPETLSVEKGSNKAKIIKLYISNIGDEPTTFQATVEPPKGLDANFADTNTEESNEYELEVGEEGGIQIYIIANKLAILGPTGLPIKVSSDSWSTPKTKTAVVNIEKKSGLF